MPEPFTLTTLLLAGAAAVGTEAVKEGTKDVYRKLKEKVGEVFGPRASKAVAKVEDASTHDEGRKELERYVGDALDPDEAAQIQPFVDALVRALKEDVAASHVAHARVGLDIERVDAAIVGCGDGLRAGAQQHRCNEHATDHGLISPGSVGRSVLKSMKAPSSGRMSISYV